MQLRLKQLSLLGLALMGASTIVAMMNNSSKEKKAPSGVLLNGKIQFSTSLGSVHHTCVETIGHGNCHYTISNDKYYRGSSTSSMGTGSVSNNVGGATGTETTAGR